MKGLKFIEELKSTSQQKRKEKKRKDYILISFLILESYKLELICHAFSKTYVMHFQMNP